ncbi:MAG TPA: hypothetical protein HPQ00_05095 [Magnetococcales bacterium]|nr:hypothetical protein [Magnetococcales bacterium]
MRIVEPVWPILPMPPSQKMVDGSFRSQHPSGNLFLGIFQEVTNRSRLSTGRPSLGVRNPFFGGRRTERN